MSWPTDHDDELFALLDRELDRQNTTLQLIASENFASPAVLRATGSVLTNKYSEGYPGKRYYGGNEVIDEVEDLARERAKALFGAEHANVQPHSGANANMAAYMALLEPGDTVLGLRLDQGGHLTHGSPVNASGRLYRFVSYGVTPSDERIDLDQVRDLALAERPKMIVTGATAYPRLIDPAPFRADRRRGRRAVHVRRRPSGGPHRRRRAPQPGRRRRHRHLHHPQDASRARDPAASSRPPSSPSASTSRSSPASRAARSTTSSPPRRSRSTRPRSPSSAPTPSRSSATRPRWRRAWPAPGFRLVSGRHRQPPHAGRPAQLRRRPLGQEGAPRARSSRHQPQREHRPR